MCAAFPFRSSLLSYQSVSTLLSSKAIPSPLPLRCHTSDRRRPLSSLQGKVTVLEHAGAFDVLNTLPSPFLLERKRLFFGCSLLHAAFPPLHLYACWLVRRPAEIMFGCLRTDILMSFGIWQKTVLLGVLAWNGLHLYLLLIPCACCRTSCTCFGSFKPYLNPP